MPFSALNPLSGWEHFNGRSKAAAKVLVGGGDNTGGVANADAQGLAWSDVVAQAPMAEGVALAVGAADVAAGQQLVIICTVAGNVTIKLLSGTTLPPIAIPVGTTILPWAVVGIPVSTATASYLNMKTAA